MTVKLSLVLDNNCYIFLLEIINQTSYEAKHVQLWKVLLICRIFYISYL